MKCAKCGWILENNLILKSGDIIKIICISGKIGVGKIIDIGENGVHIVLDDGDEMDVSFKEVKDIKKMKNILDNIIFK